MLSAYVVCTEKLMPDSSIIARIDHIHTYSIIENFASKIFNYKICMYMIDSRNNALVKVKSIKKKL